MPAPIRFTQHQPCLFSCIFCRLGIRLHISNYLHLDTSKNKGKLILILSVSDEYTKICLNEFCKFVDFHLSRIKRMKSGFHIRYCSCLLYEILQQKQMCQRHFELYFASPSLHNCIITLPHDCSYQTNEFKPLL